MVELRTSGVVAALIVASSSFVTGCTNSTPPPALVVATARDDNFLPYREINTASFEVAQAAGGIVRGRLVARIDKSSGAVTTHAVLGVVYTQKLGRHYEQARNARAEPLSFRSLAHDGTGCRKQSGCAHLQFFEVDIPEADLKRAAASGEGYPIKMFGKTGVSTLYPVPKELVAELVKSIEASPPPAFTAKLTPSR